MFLAFQSSQYTAINIQVKMWHRKFSSIINVNLIKLLKIYKVQ